MKINSINFMGYYRSPEHEEKQYKRHYENPIKTKTSYLTESIEKQYKRHYENPIKTSYSIESIEEQNKIKSILTQIIALMQEEQKRLDELDQLRRNILKEATKNIALLDEQIRKTKESTASKIAALQTKISL